MTRATGAGGGSSRQEDHGIAVQVDHLDPAQVKALMPRIEGERGRLDILVNDIWAVLWLEGSPYRYPVFNF